MHEGAFHGTSQVHFIRVGHCSVHMSPQHDDGSQKKARNKRLRNKIVGYVQENEPCTAQQIVAWLTIDRRMSNSALLLVRLVLSFHLSHCKGIDYYRDHSVGHRVYVMVND